MAYERASKAKRLPDGNRYIDLRKMWTHREYFRSGSSLGNRSSAHGEHGGAGRLHVPFNGRENEASLGHAPEMRPVQFRVGIVCRAVQCSTWFLFSRVKAALHRSSHKGTVLISPQTRWRGRAVGSGAGSDDEAGFLRASISREGGQMDARFSSGASRGDLSRDQFYKFCINYLLSECYNFHFRGRCAIFQG